MRLLLVLFCFAFLLNARAQKAQSVTISVANTPIISLLDSIEKKTSYHFYYLPAWIDSVEVSLTVNQASIDQVMKKALAGTAIEFLIRNTSVILTQGVPLTDRIDSLYIHAPDSANQRRLASQFLREMSDEVKGEAQDVIKQVGKSGTKSAGGMSLSGYIERAAHWSIGAYTRIKECCNH
jgi:hypothetical protein